ncbi:Linear gramicidin synthase subunit D [compost metagenome]
MENEDDANRVLHTTRHRAESRTELSPELTRNLNEFVQANSLTLNTVLQGAWSLLLGRYAGVDDVVFGTVVSGRTSEVADIERMIGLFINTLPVRVRLPDQQPVMDWLHDLQDTNLQIRQHEHTPLNLIRGWTDLPSGPVFHTLFVFENYPVETLRGALRPEMTRSEERVDYPIGLVVMGHEVLEIVVQYDTAFFSAAMVELLLKRLTSICQQLTDFPEQALGRVGLLSRKEQMDILAQGGASESASMSDDMDLDDYIRSLSDPDELALLEQAPLGSSG